jgi:hypothetical protein
MLGKDNKKLTNFQFVLTESKIQRQFKIKWVGVLVIRGKQRNSSYKFYRKLPRVTSTIRKYQKFY